METLFNFSSKWNNKLECNFFTTIRMSDRHNIGDKGIISFKNEPQFVGEIARKVYIEMKAESSGGILDLIAYTDTGYDWNETKNIINKMYALSEDSMKYKRVVVYLVKKLKDPVHQEGKLL